MTGVDSNVFIYVLEDNNDFSKNAKQTLIQIAHSGDTLCVSVLVITEILSGTSSPKALEFLKACSATIYDMTEEIATMAGSLRRRNVSLKTPDAIHIATALVEGATSFVTNDQKLLKLNVGIRMIPLLSFTSS